eukprot:5736492-Prymnesium_polylepis.1
MGICMLTFRLAQRFWVPFASRDRTCLPHDRYGTAGRPEHGRSRSCSPPRRRVAPSRCAVCLCSAARCSPRPLSAAAVGIRVAFDARGGRAARTRRGERPRPERH